MDQSLPQKFKMDMKPIEVKTSWKETNGVDINRAVRTLNNGETLDLQSVITPESCVLLEQPDLQDESSVDSVPLQLSIIAPKHLTIRHLDVLCEARHIEVYNSKGEYFCTVRSSLVDDSDDSMVVYSNEIVLSKGELGNECMLKFLSLKSNGRMWLYGMSIEIAQKQPQILGDGSNGSDGIGTHLANIGEMVTNLEMDGCKISENAKRFSKLLQMSSSGKAPLNPFAAFMDIFGQNAHTVKRPQESLATLKTDRGDLDLGQMAATSTVKQGGLTIAAIQPILVEMENRLWTKLKLQLDEQEVKYTRKLDRILELLEQRPS